MKTNTELLMNALGWQGGTVHQVAKETGLKVLDILTLEKYRPVDGDSRAEHYLFVGQVRALETPLQASEYKKVGDNSYDRLMYWRGVLETMKEKELDLL